MWLRNGDELHKHDKSPREPSISSSCDDAADKAVSGRVGCGLIYLSQSDWPFKPSVTILR